MFEFLRGLVRRANVSNFAEGAYGAPSLNHRGELINSQGLPERTELVRLGASWGAQIPTGSAFTFVNAWPTTRSELVLYNGEQANGLSYLIDRVWMANITSQGAAQPYSFLGQLYPASLGVAAPSNNTAVLKQQLNGKATTYSGNAKLAMANTAFALANQWFTLGSGVMSPMTTNLGASCEAFVYGRYILTPGSALCLAGIAGTAAGTAICGIEWHEVLLP